MIFFKFLLLCSCVFQSQERADVFYRYDRKRNIKQASNRMIELMRGYYEDAHARISDMNDMRFMFEESPHYELGYITSEIIERYRKLVAHAQSPFKFKTMILFEMLKYLEYVQKLYFELYHLVRMVHELPRKYSVYAEFSKIENLIGPDIGNNTSPDFKRKKPKIQLDDLAQRRKKELEKQKKLFRKLRKLFLAGKIGNPEGMKKNPYNMWWEFNDYGWEIDYYW